jgi:hypothetical protein
MKRTVSENQLSLLDNILPTSALKPTRRLRTRPDFDGATYDPQQDHTRLTGQLDRVRALLSDGKWRTLPDIHRLCGGSTQGVSARIRDLRKQKFGANTVEHRRITGGLWEYRMVPKPKEPLS